MLVSELELTGVPLEASNWARASGQLQPIARLATLMSVIRQLRTIAPSIRRNYQSASEKLFADAEKEEKYDQELAQTKERLEQRLMQEHNWTGDEKVEDTVLRMLVDKYKPLRGSMQTSDM